ncbi:ester cyclase family protein [Natrinema sp. 1APR25-10V2]|uniref:ester cyclase n=1 Tax=Natrinema sp. 1APR25-10V2 TaxID=2951081 RepID=UPI0028756C31|nr:ester cyclase family protein [Natrinema sp. 1APR25-10V2]MDS0474152.1 ester cyclase [Natrinema sp. 1APR25-10V2]
MTLKNGRDLNAHSEAAGDGASATGEQPSGGLVQDGAASTTRRTLLGLLAAGATLSAGSAAASGTDAASNDETDEYKRIVEQHYQHTAEGNLEKIERIHTSDFVGHGFGPEPIDTAGLLQAIQAYNRAIPDLQFDVQQLIAEGNYVVAYVTASGTHDGRFAPLDLPASGASVELTGFSLHRFRDGRIAEEWLVNDMYGLAQQASDAAAGLVDRVWEEAFNNGNLAVIDEVAASDYVLQKSGRQPMHGPEALKKDVRGVRTAFPDATFTVDNRFVDGTTIVDDYSAQATHQGELMGIEPTGKEVELSGVVRHHIEGGQLVKDVSLTDTWGLLQQLDAVDTPTG